MPWLFIDTHNMKEFRLGVLGDGTPRVETMVGRSNELLPALERIGRKELASLDGVCVVAGPGSFSSVRGGVLAANFLARLFAFKLVGVRVAEVDNLDALTERLTSGAAPVTSFVAPMYGAEPNIT